jgi:hypothetical protein
MTNPVHPIIAQHIATMNAFDANGMVATFADDAFVSNQQHEYWGLDAIRRWVEKERVGDQVTVEVRDVVEHDGMTIVRAAYDGNFDKTGLPPGDFILTNYFTVRNGKITSLICDFILPAEH